MTHPEKITPMLQQYLEIKARHQDAILFYRMGDFYEMFFEDAVTAARVLGITLTSRNHKDDKDRVPMCGVPYHSVSGYLAKLVNAGFRVAICEQLEDPGQARGVVKRDVVRVVTPGLTTEDQLLDGRSNRYLAAVFTAAAARPEKGGTPGIFGLSLLDLTTGEFLVSEPEDLNALIDELARFSPAELLLSDRDTPEQQAVMARLQAQIPGLCLTRRPAAHFQPELAMQNLLDHFRTANLAGFGCAHLTAGVRASGALLDYLKETQKTGLAHIERLTPVQSTEALLVDDASRRNLELCQAMVGGSREGSLLSIMDLTTTPMGARLLKKRLLLPLRDPARINRRLEAVGQLFAAGELRSSLRDILARVYDLERLNSKVVLGSANARDLMAIRQSLAQLPAIKALLAAGSELLAAGTDGALAAIGRELATLDDLGSLIERAIREDAPVTLREGNLIREGFDPELDELIAILRDGKKLILALEASERQRTGIAKLKIGFNKVFGYYLELSRAQLAAAAVPPDYIRKQTLANAERFITPELKEFENKVLGAQERRLELEFRLFCEIRQQVAAQSAEVLRNAALLARLDFFAALAELARKNRYCRPRVIEGGEIIIREGRHPVIEKNLPPGRFVPNDILLDQEHNQVLIITGPNMAGKSTVLRQTALVVLMAQMGSFVPAESAEIGVVDRIFTRVGAMDDLRRGQSTFMVEMNETANILNNATEKSLVILDEIGRGTSTFDGLAIAWAVTEDLVAKNGRGVKTLFATHYHELVELAVTNQRIKNFHIAVREWNDTIIFLHKLLAGGTSRSYGIQVAALAGVPARVVARATEVLRNIEKGEFDQQGLPRIAAASQTALRKRSGQDGRPRGQLSLFQPPPDPLRKRLASLQLDNLSPLAALTLLYELKGM